MAKSRKSVRKRDLSVKSFTSPFKIAFRKDGHAVVEVALAAAFANALSISFPLIILVIIDRVIVHNGIDTLDILFVALLVSAVFDTVLTAARSSILQRHEAISEHEMAAAMLAHMVMLPIETAKSKGVSGALSYLRDVRSLRGMAVRTFVIPAVDLCFVVLLMMLLYFINPKLFFIALLSVPGYLVVLVIASVLQRHAGTERSRNRSREQATVVSILSGIETIKATATEASFLNRWQSRSIGSKRTAVSVSSISTISSSAMNLIQKGLAACVLWMGAQQVILGELTLGQLIAFNLLALRLHAPIGSICKSILGALQARASCGALRQLARLPRETRRGSMLHSPRDVHGGIEFANIAFRYQDHGPDILCNVNFNIEAGNSVALVGSSGSGKSTILGLMMGFLVPTQGHVKVDGRSLSDIDKRALRRLVGYVPQAHYVFGMSIAENIALGAREINYDRVVEVCEASFATEFIENLPDRYNSIMTEGGMQLSGGQRQRIALARALYHDPRVLLLDEISSALDPVAEMHIRRFLRKFSVDRTLIVATHREGILGDMDQILHIDSGTVSKRLALPSTSVCDDAD